MLSAARSGREDPVWLLLCRLLTWFQSLAQLPEAVCLYFALSLFPIRVLLNFTAHLSFDLDFGKVKIAWYAYFYIYSSLHFFSCVEWQKRRNKYPFCLLAHFCYYGLSSLTFISRSVSPLPWEQCSYKMSGPAPPLLPLWFSCFSEPSQFPWHGSVGLFSVLRPHIPTRHPALQSLLASLFSSLLCLVAWSNPLLFTYPPGCTQKSVTGARDCADFCISAGPSIEHTDM